VREVLLPCERCHDCLQVNLAQHANMEWVGDSSTEGIRIEQVREVREGLRLRSFSDKPRLIILANANALTTQAANALLKSIEEPGTNQHFLLLATSRFSLLKTLASRCQTLLIPALPQNIQTQNSSELSQFAANLLDRIRRGNINTRMSLVDEIAKHACDKPELLLVIQKQLHHELRKSQSLSANERRTLLLKPIEAIELSRTLLERNTNLQLTLENWLLNTWPLAQE
jgi:hypothetical protein